MTAQEIAVADAPQLPTAIRHTLHSAAITLLMGLDLPCAAPEQARREACDAHLRALLWRMLPCATTWCMAKVPSGSKTR